ncbi:Broad specificity phosphatase PhoE [Mesobacillus persicus]|uniref:Broad specificity phosphatase PhoE n=1 Tax=Mesobacillus persicus TaxID=930146 RepID=A0A1H7WFF5_9BACI|nr:histidine phosphatase family protein [Mesobacillus persicus]SEM20322.1 Broad specificity phosphatase PhoE [Mesobacillus persicus]
MNIYVIRHGEAEHNVDRTVMAHTHDSQHNLTALGQKQVKQTGEFMKTIVEGTSVLYSSPYLRTMQTAEAVHSQLPGQVPFHQNPLIREWELGNLYDHTNRTPESKKEFKAAGQFYFRFQNGESLADVYLRATMFMTAVVERVKKQGRYDNIVVVTHAAFMQMLLAYLMNWPIEELAGFKPIENASVLKINELDGDYQFEKIFVPNN